MITVFGATGTIGSRVVAGLTAAGVPVRAFTRNPARARFGPGVDVVRGDLADPAAVRAALSDVAAAFVVTSPDALGHEHTVADAVRACGIARVVKLSSVAANPPVAGTYGRAHAGVEDAFVSAGARLTALRPAGFMTNALQWKHSILGQGRVYQPFGTVKRALIDPADIAAVAVACLTSDGHEGKVYQLTGPEGLNGAEQTERVAAALGRPLEFVEVTAEQTRAAMLKVGMPADLVDGLIEGMADPDPTRGGIPLPTVAEITGRAPVTFGDWLERNRAAFAVAA
jgi:uncharacterized protein YbjT (DUF2867 family)